MLDYLKRSYLGNKGNLLLALTSLMMVIASTIYLIIDFGSLKIPDEGSKTLVFLMFLLGGILGLLVPLVHAKWVSFLLPLIPAAMFAVGSGRMLYLTIYPLADVMENVQWFGGSFPLYLSFLIIFLLGALLAIVANFLGEGKGKEA